MELRDLEKNVEDILERNKRVELDKKWETTINIIFKCNKKSMGEKECLKL